MTTNLLLYIRNIITICAVWFIATPLLTPVSGFATTVKVFAPSKQFMQHLPDGEVIESWTDRSIILRSNSTTFVRDLYNSGAMLVIPGTSEGCIILRTQPKKFTSQISYT